MRARTVVLFALFLAAIALCGACRHRAEPPPAAVDVRLPPDLLMIGTDGVDEYGYPLRQVDEIALVDLLRQRRFDDLERLVGAVQDAAEKDHRKEYWPHQAFAAFESGAPELEPLLDEWIAKSPKSFVPFGARGSYRLQVGWNARGAGFSSEVTPSGAQSFEERLQSADQDFRRAIELRPKFIVGINGRQNIFMGLGAPPEDKHRLLAQGLEACRLCYQVRALELFGLAPRWGGSREEMARFAAGSKNLESQNPYLATLTGYPDWDDCRTANDNGDGNEAERLCTQALAHGNQPRFLTERAKARYHAGKYAEALHDLDWVGKHTPQERNYLQYRVLVLGKLEKFDAAATELSVGLEIDPMYHYFSELKPWVLKGLLMEEDSARRAGKFDDSLRMSKAGLSLDPGNAELERRKDASEKEMGRGGK